MKILLVDPSVKYRTIIKDFFVNDPVVQVAGSAATGKIALAKIRHDKFDIVLVDIDLPDMDLSVFLNDLYSEKNTAKVLVVTSRDSGSYEKIREALRLGANDVLTKPDADALDRDSNATLKSFRTELFSRLKLIDNEAKLQAVSGGFSAEKSRGGSWKKRDVSKFQPDAVVIASSTGGPMALERLFEQIKLPLKVPVFLVQHMPPPFTKNLADRLSAITGFVAREAENGEIVENGRIYVAPADFHMKIHRMGTKTVITLEQGQRINNVMPSADPLFETAASIYGSRLLGVVLTGMGEDGKRGACEIKNRGGCVMIQDQATSVVWGMPGAVYDVGAYDQIGSLDECASMLSMLCTG